MFTVEIKVNGAMVGHLYGHNADMGITTAQYRYEYHPIGHGELLLGGVEHFRPDGIEALVRKILTDVINRRSDKPKRKKI
jgi:hypothetical protein